MPGKDEIARLVIRLQADVADLKAQLGQGSKAVESFGGSAKGLASRFLGVAAAVGAFYLAVRGMRDAIRGGIESIDDLKQTTASLAAAIATNDPSVPFDRAYKIAEGMVEKIQEMDRAFVGTADELTMLVDAVATYGGAIDLSTKAAQDQFVAFGNLIKLMTKGQDFQRQAYQEVRALMEGANVQGALLVKKLEAQGVNVKKMIPQWREQGTLIEEIVKRMPGYASATREIENTLQAQKSSLQTITKQILRTAMKDAYVDIFNLVRNINDSLRDEEGLTDRAKGAAVALGVAWELIKASAQAAAVAAGWVARKTAEGVRASGKAQVESETAALGEFTIATEAATEMYAAGVEEREKLNATMTEGMKSLEAEMEAFGKLPTELKFGGVAAKTSEELEKAFEKIEKKTRDLQASLVGLTDPEKAAEMGLASFIEEVRRGTGVTPELEAAINRLWAAFQKFQSAKRADEGLKAAIAGLEEQVISADDNYGTLEQRKQEYTDYQIGKTVEEAERKKAIDMEYRESQIRSFDDNYGTEEEVQSQIIDMIKDKYEERNRLHKENMDKLKDFVANGFDNMAQTLADWVTTGKLNFKDFVNSAIADFARLIIQMQVLNALAGTSLGSWLGLPIPQRQSGGPVSRGFPYIVGEAGPELFVPATSGRIIPDARAGGTTSVKVVNESGVPMRARDAQATFDAQEMVVTLWLDALDRDRFNLKSMLGG